MEMAHAGRWGEALSCKNRCLVRVMVRESTMFPCRSSGSRGGGMERERWLREKREKAEGRRELKDSSEVRKSKGERKSEGRESL